MSDFTRLSIWEVSLGSMSWYDHVVGRKTPSEPFVTPNTDVSYSEYEEPIFVQERGLQEAWFNELKAEDYKKEIACRDRKDQVSKVLNELALAKCGEKTLPLYPYFEYMFADAGLDNSSGCSGENSIDKLSFGKQSSDSDQVSHMALSMSTASCQMSWQQTMQHETQQGPCIASVHEMGSDELQNGVNPRLTDVRERNGCQGARVQTTNAHVSDKIKLASEAQRANFAFFGAGVENSSCKEETDSPQLSPTFAHNGLNTASKTSYMVKDRVILQPISRKARLNNVLAVPHEENLSEYPTVQRVSTPSVEIIKVMKKRGVSSRSALDVPSDDDIEYLCTKKARLSLLDDRAKELTVTRVTSIDAASLSSQRTTSSQASEDFFTHKPLVVAPKGYAGQFDGMVIKSNFVADYKFNLTDADMVKSSFFHTFGDRRHPNGIYTHNAISFDPYCKTPDFVQEYLPTGHPLLACMTFANEMTIAAAHPNIVSLRNHDEEILRREAHIECAHARLEGVSVGYYRYYQGHLSIEEYHDAEMCVC